MSRQAKLLKQIDELEKRSDEEDERFDELREIVLSTPEESWAEIERFRKHHNGALPNSDVEQMCICDWCCKEFEVAAERKQFLLDVESVTDFIMKGKQ